MAYPAITTDGETVMVVDKCIEDGSEVMETVVLTGEDGKKYRPTPSGLRIEEIVADEAAALPATEEA